MHFRAKSLPVLFCFTRKTSEKAPLQRGGEAAFQWVLLLGTGRDRQRGEIARENNVVGT